MIAKYAFKGKMKEGSISKLIVTKTGHIPTQYKKIIDTLPVLCADKNFQGLNEVIRIEHDLVETNFIPTFPNTTQLSTTHHVQVSTIILNDLPDALTGGRPLHFEVMRQTHVFETNLQKELLSEYKQNSKNKS